MRKLAVKRRAAARDQQPAPWSQEFNDWLTLERNDYLHSNVWS